MLTGNYGKSGEQAIGFSYDNLVALADPRCQSRPVQNLDVATAVINKSLSLHFAGGLRDAFAAHARHIGDQFLSHDKLTTSARLGIVPPHIKRATSIIPGFYAHTLVANRGDFRRRAVFHDVRQRYDAGRGEIGVTLFVSGLVKNFTDRIISGC